MPVDLSAYHGLFVKTGIELVHEYKVAMQALVQANQTEKETYETLRRIAHSLKGQSLAMNYRALGRMWYRLEKLFAHCIEHTTPSNRRMLHELPRITELEEYIQNVTQKETDMQLSETIQKLDNILAELGVVATEV